MAFVRKKTTIQNAKVANRVVGKSRIERTQKLSVGLQPVRASEFFYALCMPPPTVSV